MSGAADRTAAARNASHTVITAATGVAFDVGSVPDCTYFRASEVAPTIDGEARPPVLHITNGYGRQRGWGAPRCHSAVDLVAPDVIRVSMSWGNKHAWGSQDYWFVHDRGGWVRRTAHHRRVRELLASPASVAQAAEGGL